MDSQAPFCQLTIAQVAKRIFDIRRITRKDQRLIISLLSSSSLGEEEQKLVNRIYADLRKGALRVID
jgi:hypothetical protein